MLTFTSEDSRALHAMIAQGDPLFDVHGAAIAAVGFMSPDSPAVNLYAQTGRLRATDFLAEIGDPSGWSAEVDPSDVSDGVDPSEVPSPRAVVEALRDWVATVVAMGEDERCDGLGTLIDDRGYSDCSGCSACAETVDGTWVVRGYDPAFGSDVTETVRGTFADDDEIIAEAVRQHGRPFSVNLVEER